jgi:hypothetical protein
MNDWNKTIYWRSLGVRFKVWSFRLACICGALLMLQVCLRADEADILTTAEAHPLGVVTSAGKAKYGDPDVDAAVEALADIPHPWTVPKMLDLFEKSDWRKNEARQARLATILAASRDPRVVPVLIKAMDYDSTEIRLRARMGLYYYFLFDKRFHEIPLDEDSTPKFYTNFIPEMDRRVRAWWELNKEKLTATAAKTP